MPQGGGQPGKAAAGRLCRGLGALLILCGGCAICWARPRKHALTGDEELLSGPLQSPSAAPPHCGAGQSVGQAGPGSFLQRFGRLVAAPAAVLPSPGAATDCLPNNGLTGAIAGVGGDSFGLAGHRQQTAEW